MGDFFLKSVRWTPSDYRDVITNYIIEECGDDRQGLILFSQFVVSYVSQFEDFCQRGITVMWLQSWSMWRWQKSKVNVTCPENRSVGRRTARTTTGWSNDNKLRPASSTLPPNSYKDVIFCFLLVDSMIIVGHPIQNYPKLIPPKSNDQIWSQCALPPTHSSTLMTFWPHFDRLPSDFIWSPLETPKNLFIWWSFDQLQSYRIWSP